MIYSLESDKKSHYIALLLAALLHTLISFWFFIKKSNPVILQQSIKVEMVAPSSQKQNKEKKEDQKHNFITLHNNEKIAVRSKTNRIIPLEEKNKNIKNSSEINSSGKIDKNAVAKNSAISEPIFNASYLQNPTPPYPNYAKARGFEGRVILEVVVSKNGKAKMVIISKSSGYDSLDNAAKKAVEEWQFVPSYIGIEAIEAKVFVPIEFKLN